MGEDVIQIGSSPSFFNLEIPELFYIIGYTSFMRCFRFKDLQVRHEFELRSQLRKQVEICVNEQT